MLNITQAYGTYVPWTTVETLAPYGTIPYAVAQICKNTWMCKVRNEDANNYGYALIATQIADYLLRRH